MQRDVMALLEGGISGVLGTLSMSAVMLVARRAGLIGQLPPERITEAGLDATGQPRSKEVQDALAVLLRLQRRPLLGAGSAVGLAGIDIVYVAQGRIRPIYLLDALAELLVGACAWVCNGA